MILGRNTPQSPHTYASVVSVGAVVAAGTVGAIVVDVASAVAHQALAAVVRGSRPGRRRYSAHLIGDGILHWYGKHKLCPRGISTRAASVRDWALRNGQALQKMVL